MLHYNLMFSAFKSKSVLELEYFAEKVYVRVGVYLLGLVGIPEAHLFLSGLIAMFAVMSEVFESVCNEVNDGSFI